MTSLAMTVLGGPAWIRIGDQGIGGIAVGGTIVEIAGPGGTFGEMAVVDQSPRTACAGAIGKTELLAIDRATLLKGQPQFAMAMLRSVAERLRHLNAQVR